MQAIVLPDLREQFADMVEGAWCAAWRSLDFDLATRVDEDLGALRIITPGSSDQLLNAVLRLRQDRPVTMRDIERLIRPYRLARRPMQWWLRLDAAPPGLRERLDELGMCPWDRPPGMVLPLAHWSPPAAAPAIQTRPVASEEDAEAALAIICEVFGAHPEPMRRWCIANPHFVIYLARIGAEPVGTLAYQIVDGVAGFFHVATVAHRRRQGVSWTLMSAALAGARAGGAHTAALTASEMAESLYRALGFQVCGQFEFWTPGPRLMTAIEHPLT